MAIILATAKAGIICRRAGACPKLLVRGTEMCMDNDSDPLGLIQALPPLPIVRTIYIKNGQLLHVHE